MTTATVRGSYYSEREVNSLLKKVFKSCVFDISNVAEVDKGVEFQLTYDIGRPTKSVLFLNTQVSLDDGTVYLGRYSDIPGIILGNVSEVISYFSGRPISRDQALECVERYKLTASIEKMMEVLNRQYLDGSIISSSVNGYFYRNEVNKDSAKDLTGKMLEVLESIADTYKLISSIYRSCSSYDRRAGTAFLSNIEKDLWPYRTIATEETSDKKESADVGNSKEKAILSSCTPISRSDMTYGTTSKAEVLAINAFEICDALGDGDELIMTTSPAEKLKAAGFTRILSARELSSVVSNPKAMEAVRIMIDMNNDVINSVKVADSDMFFTRGSEQLLTQKNTIKQLGKIITKINKIREGK